MDPQGPPQPTKEVAYTTPGNAASQPSENLASKQQQPYHSLDNPVVDERLPPTHRSAGGQPTSLAQGIRGAPLSEEQYGHTQEQVGPGKELEGEQMQAPGEGKVAETVERKSGASGAEQNLAGALEQKKAEQAELREAIKGDRKNGLVADGADARGGVQT